jgi:hypothetical protein
MARISAVFAPQRDLEARSHHQAVFGALCVAAAGLVFSALHLVL